MSSRVADLLAEGEYGDDSFEGEGNDDRGKPAPQGGSILSQLSQAAKVIEKEEAGEVKEAFVTAAKKVSATASLRVTINEDPLAAAAAEYAQEHGGGDGASDEIDTVVESSEVGDQEEEGKENLAHSIALQVACYRKNARKAESALEQGANPRYKDRHGWTALHWCASSNDAEILGTILKKMASEMTTQAFKRFINGQASDTGWTPLHVAVVKGSLDVIELLIDNPCCKQNTKDALGETAADCIPSEKSKRWNAIRRVLGVEEEEKPTLIEEDEGKDAGAGEGPQEDESKEDRLSRK